MPKLLSATLAGLSILIGLNSSLTEIHAAPGDHVIEIIGRTGDSETGPGFNPIQEIRYGRFGGGFHPVAIDDFGFVTFSAVVGIGETTEDGLYQYKLGTTPVIIAQSGTNAPGVTFNGEAITMKSIPWRGYTSSPSGLLHNFSTYVSSGTEELMYLVDDGLVDSTPLTHPEFISGLYSPKGTVIVSDGRGTTKELVLGASDSMAMANDGTFAWKGGPHIFRAKSPTSIVAVAFLDSPAPGFNESENAMFTSRMDLRGIDASGQVYFTARVTGATFTNQDVIYRTGIDSSALTLLYAPSEHALPSYESSAGPNFEADDVFPLDDGTVILRAGGNGNYTGFWKIRPNGLIDLANVFFESTLTDTDLGGVGFRSMRVDFSDFAASDDGTIFFTADVRFGANGTNQEGIWLIDPEDNSIKTIARAPLDGSFGDAPGTDETYFSFSHITADGEGHVAFMSELSNGKQGLFATDLNGAVIAIAIEGDPLDGSIIETIYFTQDHAGAELSDSQGAAGLNDLGQIVFTAELENGTTAIVKSSYETEVRPIGTTFIWDGGAGTDNWHTVVNGRSNWTDAFGTPWDKAPGTEGNEKVEIENGFTVELNQSVSIKKLSLAASTLQLAAGLTFSDSLEAGDGSILLFTSGTLVSESGYIATEGDIMKRGSGASSIAVEDFDTSDSVIMVEAGSLSLSNTISNLRNTPLIVEFGNLTIDDNVTAIGGTEVSLTSKSGILDIQTFGLSLEADAIVQATNASAQVKLGKGIDNDTANIRLRRDGETNNRTMTLNGNGTIELRQAFELGDGDTVISNHTGPEGTGVILNTHGSDYIDVKKTFVNNGRLTIQRGGLSANPESGGKITNNGTITILAQAEEAFVNFDCENNGTINQYSNVEYFNKIANANGSIYNMYGGTLQILDGLDEELLFFARTAKLEIVSGENAIYNFDQADNISFADSTFNGPLNVHAGATLKMENARFGFGVDIKLTGEDSEIDILDNDHLLVEVSGNGKAIFRGRCRALDPARPQFTLRVECKTIELLSTELSAVDSYEKGSIFLGSHIREIDPYGNKPDQTLKIVDSTANKNLQIIIGSNVTTTIEDQFTISHKLVNYGRLILKGKLGELGVGETPPEFHNGQPGVGWKGSVVVPPDLMEPASIEPILDSARKSSISVEANSSLVIVEAPNVFENETLQKGIWVTGKGASITLPTSSAIPITVIGKEASVTLNTPPESGHSLNGFPSRDGALIVEGHLTLIDHVLTFTSGGVTNRNRIETLGTSKIVGDVQNLRNDVQGTPTLAGNFNIEGNVNSDGIISMGASPGAGQINGNLTLFPGSEIIVEFAGVEPGTQFDILEVTGTMALAGDLSLHLIDEYEPAESSTYEFITAGAFSGAFDAIGQENVGRSHRFNVDATAQAYTATATSVSIGSYAEWRSLFFNENDAANDAVSGPLADPDADGLSNLNEYATGGLPNTFTSNPYQYFTDGTDLFEVHLTWAKNVADFDWILEYSTDLMSWLPLANTINTTVELRDTYEYTLVPEVLSEASTRFYRFKISETP